MSGPRSSQPDSAIRPPDTADPADFAAQYKSVYPRLVLVALGITGDRAFAEDVVQEAAIIALGKFHGFRGGSNFAAWLSEIVRRCALNHRRSARRRKTFASDPQDLTRLPTRDVAAEAWPIACESGEIREGQQSFDDEVFRALGILSDEARCCLLLRTVQQLSYAEIAELMRIPAGTAMSHVHRSKAVLRRELSHTLPVGERQFASQ
jgi:RNA polymerase sigma-70 factor (ECF subfamily)